MRWGGLYIEGFGSYLPDRREQASDMVTEGRFDPVEQQDRTDFGCSVGP